MRLHLVGLPHTQTTRETTVCAFTAKIVKFCEMMQDDYEIFVYSGDHNDAPCIEHISLVSDAEQKQWYGESDPNKLPGVATWSETDLPWLIFNGRAVQEITKRKMPGDLVLITGGNAQRLVPQALSDVICCEWAAGYEGIFTAYVCFESYAWMHYLYGQMKCDGRHFDAVIPNFFRPGDFQIAPERADYLLYVGRMIERKGVRTAVEIANATGRKLYLAGPGVESSEPGKVVCDDGMVLEGDIEYVGPVGAEARNILMSQAHAVLVPTAYIEPFGAVAIEAQLCGTPAVTTDFGAFTETVRPSFRFRTLERAVEIVESCGKVDSYAIQQAALLQYSLEAVAPKYVDWFTRLESLWDDGWYRNTSLAKESHG